MPSRSNPKRTAGDHEEVGAIRKPWQARTRVVLVYPSQYAVGMANLGFQTVYKLLNGLDDLLCERAFLPEGGEAARGPLRSLESGRPLSDFHCVAFSISFENDYPNVLSLLSRAGLPLSSASRGLSLPLVMAGGVTCFLNPEPVAPFFDCFLLGEAEMLVPAFFSLFDPERPRREMLLALAQQVPGVYVPAFYREHYGTDGRLQAFEPQERAPEKVKRVCVADINAFNTQSVIHTPHTSFAEAHLIEVGRGCHHGCRFCSAGFIYRPPRIRTLPVLLEALRDGAGRADKIGLVGAAVSDLPGLKALCAEGGRLDVQLAFSSLRADAMDEDLVAALRAGRLKTATIAPETGSERMRRVINKGLSEADILMAAEKLVAGGVPNLKLYFMVGLPTETEEDILAIAGLVKKIKHQFLSSSRARGRMGEITVSVNPYVPKPATPFQWAAMDELAVLKSKIQKIRNELRKVSNVRVHADVPKWSYLQGIFSRGDRRVAQMLLQAHQNQGNWPQTLKASVVNPSFFVHRERGLDELLPWDFIDHGLDKMFLWHEYQRALAAKTTPPCPMVPDRCEICGVCGSDG